jgi:hypothetical protein
MKVNSSSACIYEANACIHEIFYILAYVHNPKSKSGSNPQQAPNHKNKNSAATWHGAVPFPHSKLSKGHIHTPPRKNSLKNAFTRQGNCYKNTKRLTEHPRSPRRDCP